MTELPYPAAELMLAKRAKGKLRIWLKMHGRL